MSISKRIPTTACVAILILCSSNIVVADSGKKATVEQLDAEITAREAADSDLQNKIDNISLIPGPPGSPGMDGLDGFIIYSIGDIGPAGGWVFYVTNDGLHGLEASIEDLPNDVCESVVEWGCSDVALTGADSYAIGTGARNTDDIIRACPSTGTAAALADDYISPSGYFDWYLPSMGELELMHLNIGQGSTSLGNVGGFRPSVYWSSSEIDAEEAWALGFRRNIKYTAKKDGSNFGCQWTRPIRAF
jgi:hypothetical protein